MSSITLVTINKIFLFANETLFNLIFINSIQDKQNIDMYLEQYISHNYIIL